MLFGEVGETIELFAVMAMMVIGIAIVVWIQRVTSQ